MASESSKQTADASPDVVVHGVHLLAELRLGLEPDVAFSN